MISAKSDVQVDTPEVRVTEWRLAPGSATGHHIHEMDYVIVPVTSGEMTIVAPNGERSKAQLGLGKSYFRKAGVEHDVLNETGSRNRVPGSRVETVTPRLPNCHRSVAVDPSMRLKVPASKPARGVAGMLKYVSKFAMDILPSVVATIIGAYIVNHYIVTKPGADAPVAAAVSDRRSEEGSTLKARPSADVANIPAAGCQGEGHLRKGHHRAIGGRKAGCEKAASRKPLRNRRQAGGDRQHPADTRRHQPAPREKTVAKVVAGAARAVLPVAAAPNAPAPVEAAIAPEERRDANDLARAAIERLRGERRRAAAAGSRASSGCAAHARIAPRCRCVAHRVAAADHGFHARHRVIGFGDRHRAPIRRRPPARSRRSAPPDAAGRYSGLAAARSARRGRGPRAARTHHRGRRHAVGGEVGVSRGIADRPANQIRTNTAEIAQNVS